MSGKVGLFYRCSDAAHVRLIRRREGRDGPDSDLIGDRVARAIMELCDHIQLGGNGLTIHPSDDIPQSEKQRKAFVPAAVLDRVNAVTARLPGVSRDQFVREALRRGTEHIKKPPSRGR